MNRLQTILVLVHPGSFFASGSSQVSPRDFDQAVDNLIEEIVTCQGLAVVDGFLSDAVPQKIRVMIEERLQSCAGDGRPAYRIWGCDAGEPPFPGWVAQGADIIADGPEEAGERLGGQIPDGFGVRLAGAWASRDQRSGCVNAVGEGLARGRASLAITRTEACLYEEMITEEPEP